VSCVFGDSADRATLEQVRTRDAALVIVALPDITSAYVTVKNARALNPSVRILARAHHNEGHERLLAAGATEVIQPEFEAASTLIRRALRGLDLPRDRVLAYLELLRKATELTVPAELSSAQAFPELREVSLVADGLADQSLRDARIRERFGVTVVAVMQAAGETVVHPSPDTILRLGDRLLVFGLPEQIAAFEREARTAV
jgi:Trk K+ transport system NAD-binding subunit